jgi:acyl-CoA thioester hydrolase
MEHSEQANTHGQFGATDSKDLAGWMTDVGHAFRARIYYADTDFSGFVYHARYLEFLERGRSDYLRLAGIHHTELADSAHGEPLVWVVKRMEIDFVKPARMDDIVRVETVTQSITGARIIMAQTMLRGDDRLISATVEAVLVTTEGRPRRFPKSWLTRLKPNTTA